MGFKPSKYQLAVFDFLENGKGHGVVRAVAGSGKTTTLEKGVKGYIRANPRARVLCCAFNKAIERTLSQRMPRSVMVKTTHGLGLATYTAAYGRCKVDTRKGFFLASDVLIENGHYRTIRSGDKRAEHVGPVSKLAGLGKANLVDPNDLGALTALAIEYDCGTVVAEPGKLSCEQAAALAGEAMRRAADKSTVVDFDDMIWLPVYRGLTPRKFDLVMVDETQDLNKAQLALVRAVCASRGRIIAVGDDAQAIYGFRGADSEAMPRMISELNATVLPLSISYRCPVSVAALAATVVPDFAPGDNAPQGSVTHVTSFDDAKPGDFVLSRTNAPLVAGCLRFLAQGIPAQIQGRDIGTQLANELKSAKREDCGEALDVLSERTRVQTDRLREQGNGRKADELDDRLACLQAICGACKTVSDACARIDSLFADTDAMARVCFSSTHKAKGLERERVWVLADTYLRRRPKQTEAQAREEQNLWYVAVTRCQRDLFLVSEE